MTDFSQKVLQEKADRKFTERRLNPKYKRTTLNDIFFWWIKLQSEEEAQNCRSTTLRAIFKKQKRNEEKGGQGQNMDLKNKK